MPPHRYPFVFKWECFLGGILLCLNVNTGLRALQLGRKIQSKKRLNYYTVLAIACFAQTAGFFLNLQSCIDDVTGGYSDPDPLRQQRAAGAYYGWQAFSVAMFTYGNAFHYVNGKRLYSIGCTTFPRLTYFGLALLGGGTLGNFVTASCYLIGAYQSFYLNDNSMAAFGGAFYLVWATADSWAMMIVSMLFVWLVHDASIQSSDVAVINLAEGLGTDRPFHPSLLTRIADRSLRLLPTPLRRRFATPLARLTTTLFVLLPIECIMIIAALFICQFQVVDDRSWSLVLFTEAVQLRFFLLFLERLSLLLNAQRRGKSRKEKGRLDGTVHNKIKVPRRVL